MTSGSSISSRLRQFFGSVERRAADAVSAGAQRWPQLRSGLEGAADLVRRHRPSRRQAAAIAGVVLFMLWLGWERCGLAGCPDVQGLASYRPGGASVLVDRSGDVIADLAPVDHEVVPLSSLPDHVAQAFISVEDRRFRQHGGVDWRRVPGALWANIRAGGTVQGSSTITMQLARNLFSDRIQAREKSFSRKLLEVRVAHEIEDRFTKDEILELYLNHIYFGGGAYGIEPASRYYFGKPARDLDLSEAAVLAALPKAPTNYNPREHPAAARERRDLVLALMEAEGHISTDAAAEAAEDEIDLANEVRRDRDSDVFAPYFVQQVRRLLEQELGDELYAAPHRVVTTLDRTAQTAAAEELSRQLRAVESGAFGRVAAPRYSDAAPGGEVEYLQGAVVVLDAQTGDVLAWVGGRHFDHSGFDRARFANRQAGSAFKPFVYAAALDDGYAPSQQILDEPYEVAAHDGAPAWSPRNYSGEFEGTMSMREALVRSQNVPAIRLADDVGPGPIRSMASRAGITGEVPASPVSALGITAVTPLQLTSAYAAFAASGRTVQPRFVLRVEREDGKVVWEPEVRSSEIIRPGVAFLLTHMLRDAVDRGTGNAVREAGFRGPAAGKTGTTNDATDVWFTGYTPELVGTVWIGYDEVQPLPASATGGSAAAPVWGRIMARIHRDRPTGEWAEMPGDVVSLMTDPDSGRPLQNGCALQEGEPRREFFLEDAVPREICPEGGKRGLLARLGNWFSGLIGRDGADPEPEAEPDPKLGAPRLQTGKARTSEQADGEEQRGANRRPDRVNRDKDGSGDRLREKQREWDKRAVEKARDARKKQDERAQKERKKQEKKGRGGGNR